MKLSKQTFNIAFLLFLGNEAEYYEKDTIEMGEIEIKEVFVRFSDLIKHLNKSHEGDCTMEAHSCFRCTAEAYHKKAALVEAILE